MHVSRAALPAPNAGRVFVVDDDAPVRRALSRLLRSAAHAVEVFASAEDFLEGVAPDPGPACLVADLKMPGLTGLQLQDEMQRRGLDLPHRLHQRPRGRFEQRSRDEGRRGGLHREALLGRPVPGRRSPRRWSGTRRNREARRERGVLEARFERLTPREREVFALVVTGLGNKQVGWELGATEKTIKVHRARVMEKMEAGSLAELVRMSDALGLRGAPPAHPRAAIADLARRDRV